MLATLATHYLPVTPSRQARLSSSPLVQTRNRGHRPFVSAYGPTAPRWQSTGPRLDTTCISLLGNSGHRELKECARGRKASSRERQPWAPAGGHLPSATPCFAKFCAHFCSNFCSFRASRALLVLLTSVAWPWLASGKTTGPHPRPRRRSRPPSKEAACCPPAWCAGFPCPHSGAGHSTAGLRTHWLTGPSPPGRGPQASGKCRGLTPAQRRRCCHGPCFPGRCREGRVTRLGV